MRSTEENRIKSADGELISRREAVRRLLSVVAASSIANSYLSWAQSPTPLSQQNWQPAVLSVPESQALTSLSELLIPGSMKAGVVPLLDLLLTVDAPSHREKLAHALDVLQKEALRKFGKPCQQLSALQCDQLLSTAAGSSDGSDLRAAFEVVKKSTVEVYYSTEIGMTELGWTRNRFFLEFPACTPA
jgi:hypothetical protein